VSVTWSTKIFIGCGLREQDIRVVRFDVATV
jgi:hypothetical protein